MPTTINRHPMYANEADIEDMHAATARFREQVNAGAGPLILKAASEPKTVGRNRDTLARPRRQE